MDLGLLILRVVIGLAVAAHGSQKLFGWFGGGGLKGTRGFIGMLGFRPAEFWAPVNALGEFGGGLLMAAGLVNPIGPLGVIGSMLVASIAVHWAKGFWNSNGGYELPLGFMAAAIAVALTGPGKWSVDALLGISVPQPLGVVLAIITVAGVAAGLASRRRAEQPAQQAASAA